MPARKSSGKSSSSSRRSKSTRTSAPKRTSSTSKRRTPAKTSSGRASGAARKGGSGRARGGGARGKRAKAGSGPRATRDVGGKGDFGVSGANRDAQLSASKLAKKRPGGDRNPDDRQARAGVESREAGVGGREGGPGSFSGGDLDTDITGVGDAGAGLAQTGPDDAASIGQAQTSGGSEEFASGPPARGENQGGRRVRADEGGAGHANISVSAGDYIDADTDVGFDKADDDEDVEADDER